MIKIFIPSKGRSKTICTHLYLDSQDIDYKIVLHNEKEKEEYIKNSNIRLEKIIVSNAALCLPAQREWMRKNLFQDNEWGIFLDDNIKTFHCLQNDHYRKENLDSNFVKNNPSLFRQLFDQEIKPKKFLELCFEMIEIAEKQKAFLCGFATVDNPLFRCKKFKNFAYVIGKATIRKKTQISFPENWFCQEDYHDVAEHLLHFGKVLVNSYIKPVSKHYQEGGIGNYEKRLPHKIQLNNMLMKKYPDLFRYNQKVNCPKEAEIQIRLTTENQIENWRKNMLGSNYVKIS